MAQVLVAAATTLPAAPARAAARRPRARAPVMRYGRRRAAIAMASAPGYFEDANARRASQSAAVGDRARPVSTHAEFDAALAFANDRGALTIVEIFSTRECELGEGAYNAHETPVFEDRQRAHLALMEPCRKLRSTITRVARDAPGVEFVLIDADESAETSQLAASLGATIFPTVQFWKGNELLYQVNGASGAERAVAEGSLFLGDSMAGGRDVTELVETVASRADLDDLLARCSMPGQGPRGVPIDVPCEKQLCVLDVSLAKNHPECMHIFPAVVALAKNTQGAVRWGRLLGDMGADATALITALKVDTVPTFIIFHDGIEVRYVSNVSDSALCLCTRANKSATIPA